MTYCQSITQILKIIWVRCIPLNLKSKTRQRATPASYLDLLLSIGRDGHLRTSLYDKKWRFQLPYHKLSVPAQQHSIFASLWRFISQLIWYARACSSYECFILRAARLSSKLLGQWYVRERLKSSLRKFYGRYGDLIKHYKNVWSPPLPNVTWHSGTWSSTGTPLTDQPLHKFLNQSPNWTLLPTFDLITKFREVSIEHCNGCG